MEKWLRKWMRLYKNNIVEIKTDGTISRWLHLFFVPIHFVPASGGKNALVLHFCPRKRRKEKLLLLCPIPASGGKNLVLHSCSRQRRDVISSFMACRSPVSPYKAYHIMPEHLQAAGLRSRGCRWSDK